MQEHHIRHFGRFPVSQFNDSLGGVDLKCTQWVQFRSTQPKLYFPKIMEFSHYNEYGVQGENYIWTIFVLP
jgi:hypothetical protein